MDTYHQQMLDLVQAALAEDIGPGDITSLACLEPSRVKAEITAKSDGVLSGTEPVILTFRLVDSASRARFARRDGDRFNQGDAIATVEGFNQPIITAERTALNFLGHLSGIATLTSRFVQKLEGLDCQLLDTRKTTPGFRRLEKQAVLHGGGLNHRLGLYDMILIKDNHITAAGSITEAIRMTGQFLNTAESRQQFGGPDDIDIEVEVTTEDQLTEAINAGVHRLLLDNQSIESLAQLVKTARRLNPEVKLEASGNISLDNVAEVGATGVDFISAGIITHSAPNSDFSLRLVDK